MKKIIVINLLFFICPLFSQARPYWYTLEEGKFLFRSGAYGDALMAFEDARRSRLDAFTRMEQNLILLLSKPDVRRFGDSLEFVEKYIAENRETAAAEALNSLYHLLPKDSLKGSVKASLAELDRLKSYPEAEYWLGEVYRAEGELGLALRQFQKAWKERALLESPAFEVEILYKITEVHRLRREYQEMERQAAQIIEGAGPGGEARDDLWGTASNNRIRPAMLRILEVEGVSRFLTLYRHNNTVTEKAHRLLGFFCYATGRYIPAMEHLMFAFLIQNTVLIDNVVRSQYNYSFVSLDDLMEAIASKPELLAFIDETEYYKTVYYLACALYASQKRGPGLELWAFLAASSNAGEWGERARRNPAPYIESPLEMP